MRDLILAIVFCTIILTITLLYINHKKSNDEPSVESVVDSVFIFPMKNIDFSSAKSQYKDCLHLLSQIDDKLTKGVTHDQVIGYLNVRVQLMYHLRNLSYDVEIEKELNNE